MLDRFKIVFLALLLAGCQPDKLNQSEAVSSESDRLNEWFAVKYEERLQMSPLSMTSGFGRKDKYDQVDDMTVAAEQAQLNWRAAGVAELKSEFNYDALETEARTSYDIWMYQYEQAVLAQKFIHNDYIFTQMHGMQSYFAQFMINYHRVDEQIDMIAYNKRLEGIAVAIGDLLERAKQNAEAGVRPPRFAYEGVIVEASKVISGAPFTDGDQDSPLWADAKGKIAALVVADKINEAQAETLQQASRVALLSKFGPSYEALISWFEADLKNSDELAHGVGNLPNGEAYYQQSLSARTTTSLRADEIHQIGLCEVARIKKEMLAVTANHGFKGSLQDFFRFMKEDDQFYYPNSDAGRKGYISDTAIYYGLITAQLPNFFGILPKAELVVKRVESFREQDGAAQHYSRPTPDGSRPGVYYAHLSDMRSMPNYDMEAIALHEGIPGHHMQIAIAQEMKNLPLFRTMTGFTAFSEGWALYAEFLAKEMGSYQQGYSDFGRLNSEMWRAVRLVVDTGMHSKGWSEEQAREYFRENTSVPEGSIVSEVRRYMVWPGQATAYKIGMLKILELRANAKKIMGDKFDVRGFHDTVLGGGALPLAILERRVNDWVVQVLATNDLAAAEKS